MPESLVSVMMYCLKELWILLVVLMFYIPSSGWGIYREWPSSMGMATRIRMVNTKVPSAQIPVVIEISTQEGTYSTISPNGEGMNPGMINPIPFSIQIARNNRPHTGKSRFRLLRTGCSVRQTVAMIFNTMAVQIHGTRALCPWSPKKDTWHWRCVLSGHKIL